MIPMITAGILMTWKRILFLMFACAFLLLAPGLGLQLSAQGAVDVFASPVQAGCYLAKLDRCKIHVDPFTINIATGKKLVSFQLLTTRIGAGIQNVIYDFRTDQSNPAPLIGNAYTPSLVAKDFAATCGQTYTLSLQGKDTGDVNTLNLGATGQFKCPTATFIINLPLVSH